LIYITLQRAKTAREAINLMGNLVAQYGYFSEGESFSIADTQEVWVMEMIGKGKYEKGAVWVAQRIPDGYISAHANQARIRTFPLNDPDNCIYSSDVVSFAKKNGFYPRDALDSEFSFSDIYDAVTPEGARFCETRVYSFFRRVKTGIIDTYLSYVQGRNLTNRMPLYIKPDRKISLNDIFNFMRDHFEGTWFDFTSDIGAEAYGLPYRWRPLTWTSDDDNYLHERATSTQQTGFSFVSQLRPNFPARIGGIIWFGVDDSALTLHVPMYCGMKTVPFSFSEENGDMMSFSFNSAFWVFNLVSNYVYARYSLLYPEVIRQITNYERQFINVLVPKIDKIALTLYNSGYVDAALDIVTNFSVTSGDQVVEDWLNYFQYLFTKYMDGNRKFKVANSKIPRVETPGYPQKWYDRIVEETGDHYKIPKTNLVGIKSTTSKLRNIKV